jgi:cbb3-type cytochrome oxidase cytochrome c subunit
MQSDGRRQHHSSLQLKTLRQLILLLVVTANLVLVVVLFYNDSGARRPDTIISVTYSETVVSSKGRLIYSAACCWEGTTPRKSRKI